MEKQQAKIPLIGRVQRIIQSGGRKGYGFIVTDDREKFFFHQNEVMGGELPAPGSFVHFLRLRNTAEGKHDRATNIELVSLAG